MKNVNHFSREIESKFQSLFPLNISFYGFDRPQKNQMYNILKLLIALSFPIIIIGNGNLFLKSLLYSPFFIAMGMYYYSIRKFGEDNSSLESGRVFNMSNTHCFYLSDAFYVIWIFFFGVIFFDVLMCLNKDFFCFVVELFFGAEKKCNLDILIHQEHIKYIRFVHGIHFILYLSLFSICVSILFISFIRNFRFMFSHLSSFFACSGVFILLFGALYENYYYGIYDSIPGYFVSKNLYLYIWVYYFIGYPMLFIYSFYAVSNFLILFRIIICGGREFWGHTP